MGEPRFVSVADMTAVLALVAQAESAHADLVPDIDIDSARLARELAHSERHRIGILPAAPCDAPAVATSVGLALGTITEAMVVVLLPEQPSAKDAAAAVPGRRSARAAWLGPSLVAIAPSAVAPVGEKERGIAALVDFIEMRADSWRHVLVDLTGCERPGELLGILSLLDGIIVVGRAGRVTDTELARATRLVPQHLRVGVLLHE
ncbi:MAG TPA: hypothetical protein VL400_27790 [Polyangiaceae bacterium]|nr:hypothetical protein [Polyangiaceae bacterium]